MLDDGLVRNGMVSGTPALHARFVRNDGTHTTDAGKTYTFGSGTCLPEAFLQRLSRIAISTHSC